MITVSDRYGGNYPDVETMCKGQCEGMGLVPIHRNDIRPKWRRIWIVEEKIKPSPDGWHFVKCPTCGGTGKKS